MFRLQDILEKTPSKTCETIMLLTLALTSVVLEAARLDRPRDPPARPATGREPFRLAYAPTIPPAAAAAVPFCSMVAAAPAVPARLFGRLLVEE